MPSLSSPASVPKIKRLLPLRPAATANHRGTLRDLYTFGLVSVFRRHSLLRIWEPLRETPRPPQSDDDLLR